MENKDTQYGVLILAAIEKYPELGKAINNMLEEERKTLSQQWKEKIERSMEESNDANWRDIIGELIAEKDHD